MGKSKINHNVKIAVLAAISAILMYVDIPLWFAPAFYKIDLSEVAVMIGAFAFGPLAGVLIELFKIVLILIIKGTSTGFVGEAANFLIGCSYVLPAAVFYARRKNKKSAIIGMAMGAVVMTIIGCVVNAYIMIPAYAAAFKMPLDAIVALGTKVNSNIKSVTSLVLLATAPFNVFKGVLVGVITYLLYKRVRHLL